MLIQKGQNRETASESGNVCVVPRRIALVGTYKRRLGQLGWIKKFHLYNYPLSQIEVERTGNKWNDVRELWLYYGVKGLRYRYAAEFIGIKTREEFLRDNPEYPKGKGKHGDYYAVFNISQDSECPIDSTVAFVRVKDFVQHIVVTGNDESKCKSSVESYGLLPKDIAMLPQDKLCVCETAFSPQPYKKFTFIDLFAGIGGFHQAMDMLGGKCVFACDINKECRKVYAVNYRKREDEFIIGTDIKKAIEEKVIPNFDMLCGGFPCQTFSKAGKRNGFEIVETIDGGKDERGQLFFRIIDILKEHPECKYLVLENVRNLADNKKNWDIVCNKLKEQGFLITESPIIVSPHQFGIPQVRERVYILGIKKCVARSLALKHEEKITWQMLDISKHLKSCPKNCIPMLLDDEPDPRYFVPAEISELLDVWEEFLQHVQGIKSPFWLHKAGLGIATDAGYKRSSKIGYGQMPEWKQKLVWKSREMYNNNREFIDSWAARHKMTQRSLIHQKFEWNASRDCTSIKDGIIQIRQSGVRVKNPDYFPSLVAMNNTPIVWDSKAARYRYLSPREAAKLQSFREDFVFGESDQVAYRQLGNSVNVKLVKMFAEALLKL